MTGIVQSSKRELEPLMREAALDTIALAATLLLAHGQIAERTILPPNNVAQIGGGLERVKSRTGNGRRI